MSTATHGHCDDANAQSRGYVRDDDKVTMWENVTDKTIELKRPASAQNGRSIETRKQLKSNFLSFNKTKQLNICINYPTRPIKRWWCSCGMYHLLQKYEQ